MSSINILVGCFGQVECLGVLCGFSVASGGCYGDSCWVVALGIDSGTCLCRKQRLHTGMRPLLSSYCCSTNPRPCLLASVHSRVCLQMLKNDKIGANVSDSLAIQNAWSCLAVHRTRFWC